MKRYFCIYVLVSFFCSCNQIGEQQEVILLDEMASIKEASSVVPLSELLSDSCRIIPLETKDESLLGRINKIVKHKDDYYILSNDKWIFHFDKDGRYVSALKKLGSGPDEYTYISDFDVYTRNGIDEIWLADNNKIKKYNVSDLSFSGSIDFAFSVNKFKRISEDEILVMNGLTSKSLLLTNGKGEILSEYLKKEVPFLMLRGIQFIAAGTDLFIYQLGVSNSFVSYNAKDHKFEPGVFFNIDNNLMNQKELVELFRRYGQDFIIHFNEFKYIQSFITRKGNFWFNIGDHDKHFISRITQDKNVISIPITKESIQNDLFNVENFTFLLTMSFGQSSNSVLMYMEASKVGDIECIQMKNGETFPIDEEGNPYLVEFFL